MRPQRAIVNDEIKSHANYPFFVKKNP